MSLANNSPVKEPVFSPAQQQEMLARLAETFFTTSGSVTAGMRAVVTRLNDFLLSRNLRAQTESQVTGSLNLAVLHGNTMLLAHVGATQSMVLGKNQVQLFDDRNAGRGLGLSKQLVPRFYQLALEPGDVLLLSAAPPDSWTSKALSGASQLALDHLRRRLLGQVGVDITAVALKFQTGKGQIIRYRVGVERAPSAADEQPLKPAAQRTSAGSTRLPPAPAQSAPPDAFTQLEVSSPLETSILPQVPEVDRAEPSAISESAAPDVNDERFTDTDQGEPPVYAAAEDVVSTSAFTDVSETMTDETVELPVHSYNDETPVRPVEKPVGEDSQPVKPAQPQPPIRGARPVEQRSAATPVAGSSQRGPRFGAARVAHPVHPVSSGSSRTPKTGPRRRTGDGFGRQIGLGLKSMIAAFASLRARVAERVNPLIRRVLPERNEPLISLSPVSMLFLAISVPLVVVAIATTVYFNAGRAEQLIISVNNARQYVDRAVQQTEDQDAQRESWTQALLWLDKAEQYGDNEDAVNLRVQSLAGIDALDGIVRLPYREAVSEGFAVGVNITRMAATLNDVYLLDSNEGRVLRIYRVGNNYMVDPAFVCGPGQAAGQIIGPLIDISVLPPNNNYRATVLATDVNGNLVYCAPGESGYDSLMMLAPDTNWGNIKAIELSDGLLYVLDPLVNAVWYIYGNNESIYNTEPRLFFTNQVPQMDDILDFTIDQGFLYLLHSNGEMTTCEASGFELSPTRCNDPAPYGDARTGRDSAPLYFGDAHFVQMQTTQPPDPSLFILDEAQTSIYHFSLRRMNLQRQYRAEYDPDFPLPERPPTAFVITPNRRALLAFGNLIFYAPLP